MRGPHRYKDNLIGRNELAYTVDDRRAMDVPPGSRLIDNCLNRPLCHARIVFEEHAADIFVLVHITNNADESGQCAGTR